MKTMKHLVVAILAIGLVGLVSAAQADLRPLMRGGRGDAYSHQCGPGCQCGRNSEQPWHGYVVERGRTWVLTHNQGRKVQLSVVRGRVHLWRGERFRVIPIRQSGRDVVAELRHEGDVLAIVKYALPRHGGHGGRSFHATPSRGSGFRSQPGYSRGGRGSHNPPAMRGRDDHRPRYEAPEPRGRDGRGPGNDGRGRGGGRGGGRR